jgi:hypothetical protein
MGFDQDNAVCYQAVASGITASASGGFLTIGGTGHVGDYLLRLVIRPKTTAPGAVAIMDGRGVGAVTTTVYTGGTVGADLTPFTIELGIRAIVAGSTGSGWHVSTGSNVEVLAVGRFL